MIPGMTNHPGRAHGDDEKPASAEELAASVPAVQEMATELAAQPPVPPGFSPNGGKTAMMTLVEQLPQMLFQAVAQALSSVQVTVKPLPCATCWLARISWFREHSREIAEADAVYKAAVEQIPEGDPRRGMIQPLSFLPPQLQPSPDPAALNPEALPALAEGVVMVGGTLYCPAHHPGIQQQQPGKLLVAETAIPQGMLGQLFR